jgi:hypothetical protein
MARRSVAAISAGLIAALALLATSARRIVHEQRDVIAAEVEKALGKPLAFERLGLEFWRGPAVFLTNVTVADDPHFAATPFVQARRLRMPLKWLALLFGDLRIQEFVLEKPEIQIIRNEAGKLNLLSHRRSLADLAVFAAALRIADGRIDFIDRSVKEPVEITVDRLDLELSAPRGERRWIRLAAHAFHPYSREQNLSLQGWIAEPLGREPWSRLPIDVRVNVDALLTGQLARAIPALRSRALQALDIAGPVTLRARVHGALWQPRIDDLVLRGPFFGSTRTNFHLQARVDLSRAESWSAARATGKATVEEVSLEQLKRLPGVERWLPEGLRGEGPMRVAAEFAGSLRDLDLRAQIDARPSLIQAGAALSKPPGIPASLDLRPTTGAEGIAFAPSTLRLHNLKLRFSGEIREQPRPRLFLRLENESVEFSGWERLLPALARFETAGKARFAVEILKALREPQSPIEVRGDLLLDAVRLRERESGKGIEALRLKASFTGKEAELIDGSLRLGRTLVAFRGALRDFSRPTLSYRAGTKRLDLADLPNGDAGGRTGYAAGVESEGELSLESGEVHGRATVRAREGSWRGLPYADLDASVAWSPEAVTLHRLAARALGGQLLAMGARELPGGPDSRSTLSARLEEADLGQLAKLAGLPYTLEGVASGEIELSAVGSNRASVERSLQGFGKLRVAKGISPGFNLLEELLSRVNGLPGIARLLPAKPLAAVRSPSAQHHELIASFEIREGRIHSRDFRLVHPGYTLTAAGWVGFDRGVRANATLALSPGLSQALAEENRNVHHLRDRHGRLLVPFRLEGTIARVQAKPDLRRLGEMLQRGLVARDRSPQRERPR